MTRYLLRGHFVADDVKYSSSVETTVEAESAPTEAAATELLYPLAEADVARWRGEPYQCWFTHVHVEEQS